MSLPENDELVALLWMQLGLEHRIERCQDILDHPEHLADAAPDLPQDPAYYRQEVAQSRERHRALAEQVRRHPLASRLSDGLVPLRERIAAILAPYWEKVYDGHREYARQREFILEDTRARFLATGVFQNDEELEVAVRADQAAVLHALKADWDARRAVFEEELHGALNAIAQSLTP